MNTSQNIYVQFGCGFSAPEGWRNFDASPTLRFERLPVIGRLYMRNAQRFPDNVEYGDVRKGLPICPDSCAGVYASHVLEHLSLSDFHQALDETFRVLRSGGIFRLIVPDLHVLACSYLEAHEARNFEASHVFMRDSYLGQETRARGVGGLMRAAIGNSEHLWMWDELSLTEALQDHGFVKVRRAQFGDSEDAAFAAIENADRFESACAMQAKKP
jgi:SAM-dependent methyltransferase